MAGYAGVMYTDTVSALVTPDVEKKVILSNPDLATLTLFLKLTKGGNIAVKNPTHTYFEDDNLGRWATIDAQGAAVGATKFSVGSGDGWKLPAGTVLRVPRTGETILITAISGDVVSTATRSWGNTAAAELLPAEPLQIIGNAQLEGYTVGEGGQSSPVQKTARCQIFSHPFSVTGTMDATEIYDDKGSFDGKMKKAMLQHYSDQDIAALYGEVASAGSGATTRRTTTSLNETITTNSTDFGGLAMSEVQFQNAVRPIFELGSARKILVASSYVADTISNYSTMKLQSNQGQTAYGNSIRSYIFGSGELTIIVARKSLSGANNRNFFIVDAENAKRMYLSGNGQNRDTKLTLFGKENSGVDSRKGEYMCEAGFYFPQEESHMRGINVG